MNDLQLRASILGDRACTFGDDIFNVCSSLHAHSCGSGDPMDEKTCEKHVEYLLCCLRTWKESSKFTKVYDDAVYQLMQATLLEYEIYGNKWI